MIELLIIRIDSLMRHIFSLFYYLEELWGEIVVATLPAQSWDSFNTSAYGRTGQYGKSSHSQGLFYWEQYSIDSYFPKPAAHILVCGAGGGREVAALLDLGYKVSALEPVKKYAQTIQSCNSAEQLLGVHTGTYQDLIDGKAHGLSDTFDAIIFGRASFSHIPTPELRLKALEKARELCSSGPVLLSWMSYPRCGKRRKAFKSILRFFGLEAISANDRYSPKIGIFHCFRTAEIKELVEKAGYEFKLDRSANSFPSATLLPGN